MFANRLWSMLMVIGLTASCAATSSVSPGPSLEPPRASSLPTAPPTSAAPGTPVDRTTPQMTPRTTEMPPAVEELATPMPAEVARADLAHRLHADVELVNVAEVVTRTPDPDEMPCLADGSIPEGLWIHADEVQWIALSVKGNIHHYLALGDLVVYCEK